MKLWQKKEEADFKINLQYILYEVSWELPFQQSRWLVDIFQQPMGINLAWSWLGKGGVSGLQKTKITLTYF